MSQDDISNAELNGSKTSYFTKFELVCFSALSDYRIILFLGFLILLLIIVTANLLILLLVSLDHRLHTPMYFFLFNLSLLDVLITTAIIPKLLAGLLEYNDKITLPACFGQMYIINSVGVVENCMVAAMAYDRYIAVVKPLHYNVIINVKTCLVIMATSWTLGFLIPAAPIILASNLSYCASDKVMHCYCDYPAVISLACANIADHASGTFALAIVVNVVPLLYVLWTYIRIVLSVLKLKTTESRAKAFSKCSSHVIVVLIYYLSASITFVELELDDFLNDWRILVGSLNCLLIPMVNPMIYSLSNQKFKEAAKKCFNHYSIFPKNKLIAI